MFVGSLIHVVPNLKVSFTWVDWKPNLKMSAWKDQNTWKELQMTVQDTLDGSIVALIFVPFEVV